LCTSCRVESKDDKDISAAALDSYFKDNSIRQKVKIIYDDNAGENNSTSLNMFLTHLGIWHVSSIGECQFQNGLAENGFASRIILFSYLDTI